MVGACSAELAPACGAPAARAGAPRTLRAASATPLAIACVRASRRSRASLPDHGNAVAVQRAASRMMVAAAVPGGVRSRQGVHGSLLSLGGASVAGRARGATRGLHMRAASAGGDAPATDEPQPGAAAGAASVGAAAEPSLESMEQLLQADDAAADARGLLQPSDGGGAPADAAAGGGALAAPTPPAPDSRGSSSSSSGGAPGVAGLKAALRGAGERSSEDDALDRALAFTSACLRAAAAALAALSHTNAAWLRQRRRKRWWKRRVFPKVPPLAPGGAAASAAAASLDGPLLRKAAPLALLFFFASFNLVLLSASKDALIVTAPGGGVEVIPFLMMYGVLPASVAFMLAYAAAVEALPSRAVFYAATAPLLAFYAAFAFGVHPHAASLHPHALADTLSAALPAGLAGGVAVLRNWTFSLYFVAAELWGGVVISLLFWGLANEVCAVRDAKAIYPLLGIAANVALIAGGRYLRLLATATAGGPPGAALRATVASVLVGGAIMFVTKAYIDAQLLPPPGSAAAAAATAAPPSRPKKKAPKPSAAESLATLTRSPKIRNLAALVVSYGLAHRLFEVAWKGALRAANPDAGAFAAALGDVSTLTGCATIVMMLAGRLVFQHAGWGVAAAATPAVMLATGGVFFAASLAASAGGGQPALLAAAVLAGSATQVAARSFKYSLFDPAKEMVYIELSREEKTKGKATVDLVGSQVGKSGASLTLQALLLACGSLSASLPVLAAAFVAMCVYWLRAVATLNTLLAAESKARDAHAQ
jgi:AAA family ATP:ADP antiporter